MKKALLLTDRELVTAYLQGNQQALEALIERHKQKIYTSIYYMVKDQYLAEDIFQETFIKVIDKLRKGKYNEEGKFSLWVSRIAYNLCMDYFRQIKRLPTIVTSDGTEIFQQMGFEEVSMEDYIATEKLEGSLKPLIARLPKEQQDVVIMRHFFNLSFREVAEKTQSPLNTCLGRMRYALISLRKMMQEEQGASVGVTVKQ